MYIQFYLSLTKQNYIFQQKSQTHLCVDTSVAKQEYA